MRLDNKQRFPSGMESYLELNGWHFNKKMCEWASSKMYKRLNGNKEFITPYSFQSFEQLLKQYDVKLETVSITLFVVS